MEQSGVNIVLADRGWVLERLGQAIQKRHTYISIGNLSRPEAALQYYVNYSAWHGRISPVEVAYFTHIEENETAMRRFFEVATAVDHCVCHSEMYARILNKYGVKNVSVISPGVDLERFRPRVKVGVVGRTYASGRKGESLIEQVLDTEGVEWHFTGEGWPAPSQQLTDNELPKFLNELDYLLVPSLYEGGPLSLVEALACGVPVISPNVGWAGQFPHHEFMTGDVADLRRVLEERVKERQKFRPLLQQISWENWADQHDQLFRKLLSERGLSISPLPPSFPGSPMLALHGSEKASRGGPSIRVPATARAIRQRGVDAKCVQFPDPTLQNAALVHGFNIWDLKSSIQLARYAKSLKKPFVFSPIYLSQKEVGLWRREMPVIARRSRNSAEFNDILNRAVDDFRLNLASHGSGAIAGYDGTARAIIELADSVIYLSEHEKRSLKEIGAKPNIDRVVRNGIDIAPFASADGQQFLETFGVRDYVLCVGRLEWRKNQLLLLHALRDLNIPIVLIGGIGDDEYRFYLDAMRTENVHILGHLDNSSPLLASAYAGARLVVQPSWCEGAPIAALEAAASGATMILSDRSAEREYFGDFAHYCDPSRPDELRGLILDCYETSVTEEQRSALKELVQEQYNLQKHAQETLAVYWDTINSVAKSEGPSSIPKRSTVVIDITGCGSPQSSFLEEVINGELLAAFSSHGNHRFVCWSSLYRRFVEIKSPLLGCGSIHEYANFLGSTGQFFHNSINTHILVMGKQWLVEPAYLDDLLALIYDSGMKLSVLIDSADELQLSSSINSPPRLHPQFQILLSNCSDLATFSRVVAEKLSYLGGFYGLPIPPVRTLAFGIARPDHDPYATMQSMKPSKANYALVLAGAASEEGERLLIRLWEQLYEKVEDRPELILASPNTTQADFQQSVDLAPGVRHLVNVSKADLGGLIASASLLVAAPGSRASIFAFLSEGLRQFKPCIAPPLALQGTAAALIEEIDDLDLKQWSARLLFYMRSPVARARKSEEIRHEFHATEWGMTAASWIEGLSEEPEPTARIAIIGQTYNPLDDASTIRRRVDRDSLNATQEPGVTTSAFSFRVASARHGAVTILAEVRTTLADRQEAPCDVLVNDRPVGRWMLRGSKWRLFSAELPEAHFGDSLQFDVEFRLSRRIDQSLPDIKNSQRAISLPKPTLAVANIALALPSDAQQSSYASQTDHVAAALDLGRDFHLTRYPLSLELLSEAGSVHSDWGLRDLKGRPQLVLHFLQRPSCEYRLTLRYRAVATLERPLNVTVATSEGTVLGALEATDDGIHEAELLIPRGGIAQPLQLEFIGLKPVSPKELGLGIRQEPFGIGFFSLRIDLKEADSSYIRKSTRYLLGQVLSFQLYDPTPDRIPVEQYLDISSWHVSESEGTWSLGRNGRVKLLIDNIAGQALRGEVLLSTWAPIGENTTISVLINRRNVSTVRLDTTEDATVSFEIPSECIDGNEVEVCIASDRVFVPSLEGLAADDRILGVRLKTLSISSAQATN